MILGVTKHRSGAISTTFDPAHTGSEQTLSNGNLTVSVTNTPSTSAHMGSASTVSHSTGKYYVEFTIDHANSGGASQIVYPGVCDATSHGILGTNNNLTYGGWDTGYRLFNNGVNASGLGSYHTGDIIGVALDCASGGAPVIKLYKNNTLVDTYTAGAWTAPYYIFCAAYTTTNGTVAQATCNFGGSAFTYSPPAGYTAGFP